MAENAEKNGLNRQADTLKLLINMKEEGTCMEKFSMIHEHSNGNKVEPHMRSFWLIPIVGQRTPAEVSIDCEMDVYNANTTTHELSDLVSNDN